MFSVFQDGPQKSLPKSYTFQLTTFQIVGIFAGVSTGLVAIFMIIYIVTKNCGPTCDSIKVPTTDTHILVVEGPEEAEPEESTIS